MSGREREAVAATPRSGPPRTTRGLRDGGTMRDGVPAGWPPGVPPPDAPGWERAAVAWLLDQCPADYRLYEPLRRHPAALAWIASQHVAAQVDAAREGYRRARVELGDALGPEAIAEILGVLEREGLRLRAAARATELLAEALQGGRFIPRL